MINEHRRIIRPSAFKLVTAPTAEPITTALAKSWFRMDDSTDDTLIGTLITAIRRKCESFTRRCLVNTTWDLCFDEAPASIIEVPRPPLSSVTSITSYNEAGTGTVLASSKYIVDTNSEPGRIALKTGNAWPSDLRSINAIVIRLVAGYGADATNVPEEVKQAIKIAMTEIYDDRTGSVDVAYAAGVAANSELPGRAKTLLDPLRVMLK